MTIQKIEADNKATDARVAVVVSKWNSFITENLKEGALRFLKNAGFPDEQITVVSCPGAYEIPLTACYLAETGKFEGIVCIGAVIRGDTPHFDYVCNTVNEGIARLNLKSEIPLTFGVLTTDNVEQAVQRSGMEGNNKGEEAAKALLEMISLKRKIKQM